MKQTSDKLMKFAEFILGMAGVIMILIETYSVFCRNVTHWSTPWVDEVLRLIFVWIVFIGGAIAFRTDDLISLTMIEDSFKDKGKMVPYKVMKLIQYAAALLIAGMLVVQEFTTMMGQIRTGEATAITGYPIWVKTFGILLGFVILLILAVVKIVNTAVSLKKAG